MKKLYLFFLALAISLSLCACGSGGEAQEFVDYSKMELKSEEVASLNAENFDAEVEEIMISLTEQGIELSKKMVGTLLLYCNMADITEEDHNAIFIDSITEVTQENEQETIMDNAYELGWADDYQNEITKHNGGVTSNDYIGWAQFLYNAQGRAVLAFFDELNARLKVICASDEKNVRDEINSICQFAYGYCYNEVPILLDGKEVYLTDNSEPIQLVIGRAVLDMSNTVRHYSSNNKWIDLLSGAGCNEHINKALNDAWDKYVPERYG